jgi:hypothetical protein
MTDDDERELSDRWHLRQEEYRRLLQAWRRYPPPTEADPLAEARDRGRQLGGRT